MTVEERVRPAEKWKPEIASLNMGSMNFGLFPMLKRYKEFKHEWEPKMLEGSHDLVFRNSFKDIRYALDTLNATGARYEFECYDTSHLYNLHYFFTEGLVKAPLFIQTCFGLLGGIGAHPDDVMHMKRTADRLFGDNYRWSVLGAGRNQMPVAAMAAAMGGNVRVGLEDSLWVGAGKLAPTNAAQVTQVRKIIEGLGLEIATPDEAREILSLKGGDRVGVLMLPLADAPLAPPPDALALVHGDQRGPGAISTAARRPGRAWLARARREARRSRRLRLPQRAGFPQL